MLWPNGFDELSVFVRREIDDLATLVFDGFSGVIRFNLGKISLKNYCFAYGLAHRFFQIFRPSVICRAVRKDPPGNIKVVGNGMMGVELVNPVSHGIRKWIFLRVDVAAND